MNSITDQTSPWRRIEALLLGLMLCTPLACDFVTGLVSFYKSYYIYLLASLLVTAFLIRPWFRCGFAFIPSAVDLPMLAFLAFAGLSFFWSVNAPAHLQRYCLYLSAAAGFYLIRIRLAEDDDPLRLLLVVIAIGGMVALLDSLAILLSYRQHFFVESAQQEVPAFKAESMLFTHNNVASLYTIGVVPLAYTALLCVKRTWKKVACLFVLGLLLGYVVLLRSRAAWFEAPIMIIVITTGYCLRNTLKPLFRLTSTLLNRNAILIFLALLMLAVFLLPMSADFSAWGKACFMKAVHEFDLDYRRHFFRLDIWRKTVAMISDHLWIGVGLGNFAVVFPAYHRLELPKSHPHSEYFNVLVELGVVGMLLYALMLLLLLRAFVQGMIRASDDRTQLLLLGVGAALLVEAFHGLVEPPMVFESSCLHLFICSGLLVGMETRQVGQALIVRPDRGGWFRKIVLPLSGIAWLFWIVPALVPAFTQGMDLKRAGIALQNQDYATAEALFRNVSAKGWESYYTYMQIGDLCYWQKKHEQALEAYERAETLFPHNYKILCKKGVVLRQLDRPEEAFQAISESLEYNQANKYAQMEMIRALLQMERFKEAFQRLELFMQSKRPSIDDLMIAGGMYYRAYHSKTTLSTARRRDFLLKALDYFERSKVLGGEAEIHLARIKEILAKDFPN